jgi:hypothetical protein
MREVDGSSAVSGCRATAVFENRAAAAGMQQWEPGGMPCRLTVQRLVLRLDAINNSERRQHPFSGRGFRFEVSTADLRFTKKQQSGSTNTGASGGRVMVHRTDIAGSVGGSMGQVSPGDDGICRHAPNGIHTTAPPSKKIICRKPLPVRTSAERSAAVY